MKRASRILALLVRLYPEDFRRAHEAELLDFIETDERRKGARGFRRALFWVATASDLVRGAFRLRWEERGARPRAPRAHRGSSSFGGDLRQAMRSLRATPAASLVIVATLALAIGLDTAIASVVNAVLFEPLPYREPERLFLLDAKWTTDDVEHAPHTGVDFTNLRRDSEAFEDIAAVVSIRQNLTGVDLPVQVRVGWASTNLFDLLGVAPALGPGFQEDSPPGTLVLSDAFWRDAFGARDDVIGSVVWLDGQPYTIAGVLPRGFTLELPRFQRTDVWKVPDDWWQNGDAWTSAGLDFAMLDLIGRLRDGATEAQTRNELDAFAASFREARTEYARAGLEYDPVPLQESVVGAVRPQLLLLLGAVLIVLLVACANVTSLMLARAQARSKELALRIALGASRAGIFRLVMAESLVVALSGGAVGVLLALGTTRLLAAFRPENLPRVEAIALDSRTLLVALAVTLGSTLSFGLSTALVSARRSASSPLLDGARTTETEEFEIQGVAADVRYQDLKEEPEDTLYFDSRGWSWTDWEVDFVVRTEDAPETLVGPIREELLALDPGIPLARPRTMKAYVSDFLAPNRFALTLIGLFAFVAGLLALVGLYGSLSHEVAQSRREIGIRMALGSDRGRILYWVYRRGFVLLATGIGVGLVFASGLTRYLSTLLVQVAPTDAVTFAVVAGSLALVGSLACYLPARKATRTDPLSVLRSE